MRPTLRERWRWWRWLLNEKGGPAQFSWNLPFPDKATRRLIYRRWEESEPWPRKRHGRWITNEGGDDAV